MFDLLNVFGNLFRRNSSTITVVLSCYWYELKVCS